MAPARRRRRRWADLPPELVEAILTRLTLDDHLSVGLVCKPWRSATINARSLFKPYPLLILKPGGPYPFHHRDRLSRYYDAQRTCFYSIRGGRILPVVRPPNPSLAVFAPGACCFGSSMGWLFMMDVEYGSMLHLLNFTSDEKVALPDLPPHVVLRTADDALCSKPPSDQGCVVVVEGTMTDDISTTVLLTCRPKDDDDHGWTEIRCRRLYTFALYEGRLYVIDGLQEMDVYDFDPDPRKIGSVVIDVDGRLCTTCSCDMLLAVADGKLLLVFGSLTGRRLVYELVVDRWARIQSLGDWALLMHQHTSQAFSTKESPSLGFRANCIYQPSRNSIVVYSMEDGSSMTLLPPPEAGIRLSNFEGCLIKAFWFLA